MKHIVTLALAVCIAFLSTSAVADYVTANMLCRVLCLRNGAVQGTGFTVEVDGRQYIVTAGHLLSGTNQVAVVETYRDNEWKKLPVTVLRSAEADVAVLVPSQVLTPTMKIILGSEGTVLGQDVYFLGFPYMLSTDVCLDKNNGFPIPFVKKGILSAWYKGQTKYATILVDGINNSGFSGGPLVATGNSTKDMMVLGVVTAYVNNPDTVISNNVATGLKSLGNSGIIICYDIQYAIDEIKKQQNGPKVSQQ
jgi:S1-C subfamily serine protease